jgi:PAS domain S-box-containing protein
VSIPNNNHINQKNYSELFQLIFEKSPISITLLNLKGQIIDVNSATEQLTELDRKQLIGTNYLNYEFFPKETIPELKNLFNNVRKGQFIGPLEMQIVTRSNKRLWISVISSLVKLQNQTLIQVLTQDITLRKSLEIQLHKSDENYRLLTQNISEMITIVNSRMEIEYINEDIHFKTMGYKNEDLIGIRSLNLIYPDDKEKVLTTFKEAYDGNARMLEARIINKNGNYIWTETSGKLFKDDDGNIKFLLVTRDISERKKNAQILQESKDRYRNLTDSLLEVVFELDTDYNLTYTNSIASKIFGYSHEDFKKGLTVNDFIIPEERSLVENVLKRLFKGEILEAQTYKLKKKDGSTFYGSIYATPIYKGEEIVGIRSVIHDISDMKEAEKKIKESEEKFRTIAEQSLMGICIIQDEVVKYINQNLANLLGYSVEDMLNWKQGEFFKTIHPKDKKQIISLATSFEYGDKNFSQHYEARGITKDGKTIWVDVYYKIILYEGKSAFLVSFIDISDRKDAQERLRESEEKYRFLFQNSPFAILLIETSGRIVDFNPSLQDLIGYSREELIGKKYKNLSVVPPEYIPILLERLEKISKGISIPPLDIKLIRKDGIKIWVNIESSFVKIDNKPFIIIMMHNISEKKKAEQGLKELDEMRKDFIDKASHELKTPITTVYGAYQLLDSLYRNQLSQEAQEIFDMAVNSTKRLKKLVDELLDISRIESKKFTLDKRNANLSQLISDCVKELTYFFKKGDYNLILDMPDNLFLNLDASRIELVIMNLLTNAIKYTPKKGTIYINLKEDDDYAEIQVKDTGIGLTKNEIGRLFKKFSKLQTPLDKELDNQLGSTGLGLHLAKEIVELHGGLIEVKSEGKNKGATFIVRLPFND